MPVIFGDHNFEISIPVLVVGGGACGLTAALALRDADVPVMLLERDSLCRGSSSMSLGALCASGSKQQAIHGADDSADIFYADIMAKTHNRADPVLARLVAEESGPALDWLSEKHGIDIALDTAWRPAFGHSRMRLHVTPGRTGQDLVDRLLAACERAGVDIINDALVTDVFATRDRRVTGVRITRPDGTFDDIGCDALILATCGFGGNHSMIATHIPDMREARYFGWEGNQGDGISWGQALGAATADMDAYQGLGLLSDPQGIDVNPRFLLEGGFQINSDGKRFSDELDDVSGQGARVIQQAGGIAWVIYDERIHQSCESLPQYRALREIGGTRRSDSIEALAALISVPVEALEQTFAEATKAALSGQPDSFGRHFNSPPLAAPFYAIRVTGALFHTQGGLVVDGTARVVDQSGTPLPNIFAGGGAARSISGPGPSGYLPGAGLCMAITLGRVAGENAAKLVS